MNNGAKQKLPKLFWSIAVAALIWNLLGVLAYVMEVTMSAESMAALPLEQQALYAEQPAWVTGAFAIAVFAGLLGSIALVLRKGIAIPVLSVSLLAVIAQMYYLFTMSDMLRVMGTTSAIMPTAIVVIAAALLWFSSSAKSKGWIG